MIRRVVARAYANIALIKYWGKRPGLMNVPATPSISLALDALVTETVVERLNRGTDLFFLNDAPADEATAYRLLKYLDLWRNEGYLDNDSYSISSTNRFPTKAGLASSSSGFAALATALGPFSPKKLKHEDLSRLARRGSGSASRSVAGGLAAMPLSQNPYATQIHPPDRIPWGMVIVIVHGGSKEIGSTEGMELSRQFSPYYKQWLIQAKKDYRVLLKAVKQLDFSEMGQIAEANALAMHACMIATRPPLVYWNETTIQIIRSIEGWRKGGLEAYVTIDAGHHLALLGRLADLDQISGRVNTIQGVKGTIICNPAGAAEVIVWE